MERTLERSNGYGYGRNAINDRHLYRMASAVMERL